MRSDGIPEGRPFFMGSLPFLDHGEALKEVMRRTPETPHWVQLPAHPKEDFLVQFCEGVPGLHTEPKLLIRNASEGFEEELLEFYEEYVAVTEGRNPLTNSRFTVSREAAPGLHMLMDALTGSDPLVLKGQISGPLSVLLGIHDDAGRLAYYDERIRDVVVKLLTLKARWQVELLKMGDRRVMVFVDEPAMGGLGSSSYISVSPETVLSDLNDILRAIKAAGGWAGVHVCANTDWGALLTNELDVLSFDAFSYFDRLFLYRKEALEFIGRGGMIAWGIVPTDPKVLHEIDAEALAALWRRQAEELAGGELSTDRLLSRAFITPSCGMGTLKGSLALRAMDLTVEVSSRLRG